MNGLYTEYSNLTPYHINWLDGCGKSWVGNGSAFSKYIPNEASVCYSILTNSFEKCRTQYYEENDYTHCPTGDAFCQGIAEILGIEYVSEEVAIPKTETTIKGMAIEVSRLSEEEREWLVKNVPDAEMALFEYVGFSYFGIGYQTKDWYQNNGYTITESPTEFLKYVAQQTGKEYKQGIASEKEIAEMLEKMSEDCFTPPTYPHKIYRILDSLDRIPLDTRIPLSEWIPPFESKGKVTFISKEWFERGYLLSIDETHVLVRYGEGKEIRIKITDGHWMRIV